MSDSTATIQAQNKHQGIWKRLDWFDRRRFFWIVFAVALLVYTQSQFWKQPSGGDRANWDYFAQVIARGGVPYRDVVNIKSPLSAYIGAAAIVATRPFGLRDILAIRITFILLAALTVAFSFLVASDYFGDVRTGLLAATIMLTFNSFLSFNGGGVQSKTPMVLFGLVTLWAVLKDRPLTAGFFGMLSALSWQPGLLFVGAAGLTFSRYLTNWRDLKAAKLVLGAIVPLAILLAYFWVAGALREFYLWNIHFNATVYGPREVRSLSNFFDHLSRMLNGRFFQSSRVYFYLAIAGLFVATARELRRRFEQGRGYLLESAPKHAIVVAPLVYFAFCMIDIQGRADILPLLPFVAIFAALVLVFVIKREANLFTRVWPKANRGIVENSACVVLLVFISFLMVRDVLLIEHGFPTLQDQEREVAEIVSHLQPGDKVFIHGSTEILVLSGLTNASKYFFLDRGKDEYLDRVEPGGFRGWLDRLKAEHPKIVALNRVDSVDRIKDLQDWVSQDYEMLANRLFTYFVRKDDQEVNSPAEKATE